jgi:NADP-dependent 3-hydroxy acid dehydrogenase YdfG
MHDWSGHKTVLEKKKIHVTKNLAKRHEVRQNYPLDRGHDAPAGGSSCQWRLELGGTLRGTVPLDIFRATDRPLPHNHHLGSPRFCNESFRYIEVEPICNQHVQVRDGSSDASQQVTIRLQTMRAKPPVALVTGCNSGIGKEIAVSFASNGVTVLATARKVESLQELVDSHTNIEALPLSLDSSESINQLGEEVARRTGGRLDYVVNNAGSHYAATALDLDVEEVAKLFQVNVFAVMRLCQMFVPLLRNAPHGKIVQIGSVTRSVPVVWQPAYNASKAALSQYTKTLRLVSTCGPVVREVGDWFC